MTKKLIWVDLETTGLDDSLHDVDGITMLGCQYHDILEIGIIVTDENLVPLDEGFEIVINAGQDSIDKMPDIVKNMHEKNGLIERCKKSDINYETATKMTLDYLEKHAYEKGSSPMCGNNIRFDRMFLATQMPKINEMFHYRQLDVSSFKVAAQIWAPDVVANSKKKKQTHRGLDDILESIEEFKDYKENLLMMAEPKNNSIKNSSAGRRRPR